MENDLISRSALKEQWTIASPEPFATDAAEVLDSIENAPNIDAILVDDIKSEIARIEEADRCDKIEKGDFALQKALRTVLRWYRISGYKEKGREKEYCGN